MIATLRRRDFALLWLGGLISLTGDWMLVIALPVYVYILTGSALTTSLMFIAAFLPQPLLSPVAGVFADRWDRKRTLVVVDLLLTLGLLPLLLVHSAAQLWIVYAVAFAESCLEQFFTPAESALLPTLVDAELLVPANALGGLNRNLSRLIGPALGGVVAGVFGLPGVVLGDAASFLLSAALIALIARPARPSPSAASAPIPAAPVPATAPPLPAEGAGSAAPRPRTGEGPGVRSLWREGLEGLRLVRRERTLSTIFAMSLLMGLGEGIFGVLLVVFVRLVLRGGALQYGSLMSAQAIGGLLGGAAVGVVGRRFRPARLLGWCALAFGVVDLLIVDAPAILDHSGGLAAAIPTVPGLSAALLVVLALFVVVGLPGAGFQAALNTLIQSAVPERLMGRVFGALNALMALTMLAGMILAGGLGDRLGPVPLLNLQGSMYALAGLLALARLRGRWAAPRPAASPPAPAPPPDEAAGVALGVPPGRHS